MARDTKPFTQPADRFRGELKPGDPVHDIGLRLAIDDSMTIREAEATMRATPYPDLHRGRTDPAAAGRRAHRHGLARSWSGARSAGSRPARICRNCSAPP